MLIALLKCLNMLNVERNIYKVYSKIPFHCPNMHIDSPLSSNRFKLEKQQLRNWRLPQRNFPEDHHPESRH